MSKETLIKVGKACGAGAVGALVPLIPEIAAGLPEGSASVIGALVSVVLLFLKRP